MGQAFSVFISAVTREFGSVRDALANALQARGIDVRVQRSFELGADTTLAKLHDYIRGCDRVIALIGDYSGMFPPEGAVTDAFRAMLPPGMARASLTQWEIVFARHYGRQVYFFEGAGYAPERPPGADDDPAAQAAWRQRLFDGHLGCDRRQFQTSEGFRADVMELDWPARAELKPSNLPSSIGTLFKGRTQFLERLRDAFARTGATAIVGKAVHGLGGIGKTRAAIEYAHAYAGDYSATFFLIGKSDNDLNASLAALARPAVLDLPEAEVPDPDTQVAAVVRWLRANPGWLLIVDNVDDDAAAGAVRGLLDRLSHGGGHLLVTSRVSDWGALVQPVELDLISIEAATDLLLASTPRRTRHADEAAAVVRLAGEQLGCLSLALVQAAAYIDERRIGFADYAALFDEQARNLLAKLGPAAERNLGYALPIALTWQTSFAQLGEAGRLLLDMLAWLSIEPIPRRLFAVWPQAETIDLDEALVELTRYNLVQWEAENSAITLHRLVAQVTRDNLDGAGRDRALAALFPWLYAVNPDMNASDARCWPRLLPLLPHALLLFERTQGDGPFPFQASLYDEYATLLRSLARFGDAEPLFRRALALDEAAHGPDDVSVATRLNNLAGLLRATSRAPEAEPLYRRALAIGEANLGPDHAFVATDLNNLASLLRATGRLEEAEPLFRRALDIDERYYGPDHSKVATDVGNLAGLLRATGRTDEAEALYRRAVAAEEANCGPVHPRVATHLNNLASLLQEIGRPAEAEPLFRRAIAIDETIYGPDHPEVATDLNNLAGFLYATARETEAEPLCQRAALIFLRSSKASGHLLPHTVPTLENYAAMLTRTGHTTPEAVEKVNAMMTEAGFDPAELWPLLFEGDGDAAI